MTVFQNPDSIYFPGRKENRVPPRPSLLVPQSVLLLAKRGNTCLCDYKETHLPRETLHSAKLQRVTAHGRREGVCIPKGKSQP